MSLSRPRWTDRRVPLAVLRAVAAVVAQGGVTVAARSLHLSASTVTRAVQSAERQLGVALFARGARGMVANDAGELLGRRVARALEVLRQAAEGLRQRGAPATVQALPRHATEAMLEALVARARNPTEQLAADSMGISQSALHQALRRLEHLARLPLLERTRQGARLTEAGRWMLRQSQLALAELRVAHEDLARWQGQGTGHVTVGALPMASDVLVPQAAARALREHPELALDIKDGTYESLVQMLRAAEADFLIGPLRGPDVAPDLQEEVLYVDRFVAVVRMGHPLLKRRRPATLAEMSRYPWVGPLSGTPAFRVFHRLFEAAGLEQPTVSLRAHSVAVVRSVLQAGDHVALMSPLQAFADVQAGTLALASGPIPGSERAIGITQRRDAWPSDASARVLEVVRSNTATLVRKIAQ